jgi:hypothetical protein
LLPLLALLAVGALIGSTSDSTSTGGGGTTPTEPPVGLTD